MKLPHNLLEITGNQRLVFCKDPLITSQQMAVLIIKPSNRTPNSNNSFQNITGIIGRIEAKGWQVHGLKVIAGSPDNVTRIAAHYPQPFFDSAEDVRSSLSQDEQRRLLHIWGYEAVDYPIYHPVHLSRKSIMNFSAAAEVWHKGRGVNNQLLDVGHPEGINSVTATKDVRYGKRRLYLVRPDSADPFFIINGFTAELVSKFSRAEERIVIMAITQSDPIYGLNYLREHVIGATNPHDAQPGSIRYDALHNETYTGSLPITSRDEVGIENNIVHLSDSLSEASRELAIWMPELLWYPPSGPFAPDIPYTRWRRLRRQYLEHRLHPVVGTITNPQEKDLIKLSAVKAPAHLPTLSVNIMAGGSGGRLFGYELPEDQRNKLSAPLVPLNNKVYSFLELQLARLASYTSSVKAINIIASASSVQTIKDRLDDLRLEQPKLMPVLTQTSVLVRQNVPRIIPKAEDLLGDDKFQQYCEAQRLNAKKVADSIAQNAGDIARDEHAISSKPPGHLSVLLHYIYHRLHDDVAQGVEVAYFHIGEDSAAGLTRHFWQLQKPALQ